VRVTDDDGSPAIATLSATVVNLAPEVNAESDQPVNLGDPVTVNADFTDKGILDIHTATINWGGGSIEPQTVIESNGAGTFTGSHIYAWPDSYEVTVTVTDKDLGEGSCVFTVEVLPIPEVMVECLCDDVDTIDLSKGTEKSLNASLDTATKVLEDSNPKNDVAAINALEALINKIEAQRGKKMLEADANALIAKARDIIAVLSGET